MKVIAIVGLRVSDGHGNPSLEAAPLGTRCDWQPGDELGQAEAWGDYSVCVITKYGKSYVARCHVRLEEH